jgi:hypothetical protein
MRWPRRRVRLPAVDPEVLRSAQESVRRLEETREQMGEVDRMVQALKEIRTRNNFAGMIAAAWREHR